jgi:hypothetical protein
MITVVAYAAQRQAPPAEAPVTPVQLSAPSAPTSTWMPIAGPLPVYGVDAPGVRSLPFAFTARRDAAGAREDNLSFGSFDQEGEAHLRIILERAPNLERPEGGLFLDLARRASGSGLAVMRSTPPEGLVTKFGPVESTEITLSDAIGRTCIGFRFAHQEVGFRVAGWLCPAKGQAIDRRELVCTLDRLSLVEPGNDEALKLLFGQADRQRIGSCAPAPVVSTIAPPPRGGRGERASRQLPPKPPAALRRESPRGSRA